MASLKEERLRALHEERSVANQLEWEFINFVSPRWEQFLDLFRGASLDGKIDFVAFQTILRRIAFRGDYRMLFGFLKKKGCGYVTAREIFLLKKKKSRQKVCGVSTPHALMTHLRLKLGTFTRIWRRLFAMPNPG